MDTATTIAEQIVANVNAYYEDLHTTISHAKFKETANALWRKAEEAGCQPEVACLVAKSLR